MAQKVEAHILQRYELVKKIGNGAYGHVWKAVDRKSKKIVALKKIFDAFQHSTDAQRTYREIMFLQEFDHENIIKLLDVIPSQNDQDIYLIFQHMDIDLYHLVKQDILKKHQQQFIIYQIAKALKYLHSAQLLHRDIKPSNILIDVECKVKLCDFGLVRSLDNSEQEEGIILTQYVATRWYRAPEILMGSQSYTKGVDIWSLGCLIAEMIKGRPLFPGTSTIDQLERVVSWTGMPKKSDIQALGSDVGLSMLQNLNGLKLRGKHQSLQSQDKTLLDLVNRMLQFNPRKRIPIDQVLKHPYLFDFHNPKQEPRCDKNIRVPISDNKRLSVKEYKMLICKEISRRSVNKSRQKDTNPGDVECSIPINFKKPERKTSLRGNSKQSDSSRGKSIGVKNANSTKTKLRNCYASPTKLLTSNNQVDNLKYQALKAKFLTESKQSHYGSISRSKAKSTYSSKKHSLKTQGNVMQTIPTRMEDSKKRSQSINSNSKRLPRCCPDTTTIRPTSYNH